MLLISLPFKYFGLVFVKLADTQARHKISDEFENHLVQITFLGVMAPYVSKHLQSAYSDDNDKTQLLETPLGP